MLSMSYASRIPKIYYAPWLQAVCFLGYLPSAGPEEKNNVMCAAA